MLNTANAQRIKVLIDRLKTLMIAGRDNYMLLEVTNQVLAINFLQTKAKNVFIQRKLFGYKSIIFKIVSNAKAML